MNIVFADQGYILCSSRNTLGYDSCYDCPIGTVNELPMDTSEITYNFGIQEEQCRKFDCDCSPGRQEKEEDFLWYGVSNSFKWKLCSPPKGDNYENDENKVGLYFSARWPLQGTIYQFCTPLIWPSFFFCLVSLSCLNKCDINDIKRNLIFKILWSYPDEDLNEGCYNHYWCTSEHYKEVFQS